VIVIVGELTVRRHDGGERRSTMSKQKDLKLKHNVEAELEWDPEVDARKIAVAATEGVVTLSGHVRSYFEKWRAEKIAKRIHGAYAVANEIDVQLTDADRRDDTTVATSALDALDWTYSVPKGHVRVLVSQGLLTLEGDVEWQFQKRAAEDAVRGLRGVRSVTNEIVVKSRVQADDVKSKIEAALKRSAEVDSQRVLVQASDSSVTLSGKVRSWAEREDAVNAAWAAPGVTKVFDNLSIQA
jgi:osmotically-inducible protein OsmY